ncbi:ACT domain-containing protein [Thermococcus sp. Bubb.Bath]|uniref:ACT domain-containing protein n=1 Tax=Thermococcus sp. Bubb.Bath TaxID=1638242 RepID=UPI00143B523C|nr:ACT domain-containing protein [Thermococcus sp. Bubb.Bath]NJF24446.1 ACT domain-containing protein [Thermococcus sp. Bubb.Bath]
MRHYELIKVKEDGAVEIPLEFAYELGLVKGAYFLVEVDTNLKEAHMERIALPGKKLVEVELVVEDRPGVLARVSGLFGKHGINILFNESEELSELGLAAIVAIVDVSGSRIPLEELEKALTGLEEVRELTLREVE